LESWWLNQLTCLEELDSDMGAFRGLGASSSSLTTFLDLSATGVEGFVVVSATASGGFAPVASSTLGGFVLARFLDGPIK
jgi:hypothetical protein